VLYAIGFASLLTLLVWLIVQKIKLMKAARLRANSTVKLDADLWKVFSKYIRSKDADWNGQVACFTCGKIDDYRAMDAGHYLAKATTNSYLKFYEKNVNPQCISCNRWLNGNYAVYKVKLIEKYGQGIIADLNSLRSKPPLTIIEFKDKITYYTNRLKIINSR
jgi:DNA-directed RNA polymerase subunit N (RpoN/RPB10)